MFWEKSGYGWGWDRATSQVQTEPSKACNETRLLWRLKNYSKKLKARKNSFEKSSKLKVSRWLRRAPKNLAEKDLKASFPWGSSHPEKKRSPEIDFKRSIVRRERIEAWLWVIEKNRVNSWWKMSGSISIEIRCSSRSYHWVLHSMPIFAQLWFYPVFYSLYLITWNVSKVASGRSVKSKKESERKKRDI